MPTDAQQPTSDDKLPSKRTALLVFGTIADTTWRMFVPSVGGALLGVWADNSFNTKPWFTVVGVTLGFAIVVGLVWLQYRTTEEKKR